jgi:hypothetical protein
MGTWNRNVNVFQVDVLNALQSFYSNHKAKDSVSTLCEHHRTYPLNRDNILRNYEQMEQEKTKLLVAIQGINHCLSVYLTIVFFIQLKRLLKKV